MSTQNMSTIRDPLRNPKVGDVVSQGGECTTVVRSNRQLVTTVCVWPNGGSRVTVSLATWRNFWAKDSKVVHAA
jgi:riboflavin synthase alpha subunit